jgi:hypothetical protein
MNSNEQALNEYEVEVTEVRHVRVKYYVFAETRAEALGLFEAGETDEEIESEESMEVIDRIVDEATLQEVGDE